VKLAAFVLAGLLAGGAAASLAEPSMASRIDAGLWEVTSTVTSGDMPGAPIDVGKVTDRAPTVARRCLTSEEAAKGAEAMLLNTRDDCTATRSTMADGKLDALLQCAGGTDKAMTIAIKANFAPKSYDAVSDIVMARGGMAMRVDVAGKWVGPCSN
jgi:hypothetical protein